MRLIAGTSMNSIYRDACHQLMYGKEFVTRSKGTTLYEISNVMLELSNPINNLVTLAPRRLSTRYAAGELAFYLAGSDSLSFISHYSKFWRNLSDDGTRVHSCYGKRLLKESAKGETQIGYVIKQLTARRDTKKAVALIYKERDTNASTKDNPCTMYLHFCIRDEALNLTVQMRSNDVWYGLPYDAFFFTVLQQIVLAQINAITDGSPIRLGTYSHFANSLHVYEKDWERVASCARALYNDLGATPSITTEDLSAISPFLHREDFMRNAPDVIPPYDNALDESEFFSLMVRFLEGRNA